MSEQKSPPLSHPVGVLHEIRWNEICPWLILVRSLRASLLVRVLILACIGLQLTQLGWTAVDRLWIGDRRIEDRVVGDFAPLQNVAETAPRISVFEVEEGGWIWGSPLTRAWKLLSQPLVQMARPVNSWRGSLALACSAIWAIAVWSFFGGAIARISAMQLTRGETIGFVDALKAALSACVGIAGAPLIALLGAAALSVPLLLAGLLIRFDLLALLTGLAWIFVLVWGLMLAVVLLGLLFGWPMMWATLAVERSDAFDAVSRCYAYVYQRPLHLAFYIVVASLLGVFGEVVVYYFSGAAMHLGEWAVSWGAGVQRVTELTSLSSEESTSLSGTVLAGAKAIAVWKQIWMAIAASYPVAYLWSAAVGIYLLLRRHIDATEMDEISLTEQQQLQGLPELEKNKAGLPKVKRK
jgi:hypothetical protein